MQSLKDERMSIATTYNFSFQDFMTLIRARRSSFRLHGWKRYAVFGIVFSTALTLLDSDFTTSQATWGMVAQYWGILFCIVVSLFWLIDQVFDRLVYKWIFRSQPFAGMEMQLIMHDEALDWSCPGRKTRLEWHAISKIVQQPDAFVLLLSAREGLVVPLRSFDTEQDFVAAYEFARDRINA